MQYFKQLQNEESAVGLVYSSVVPNKCHMAKTEAKK
jgi:hypothetical protein